MQMIESFDVRRLSVHFGSTRAQFLERQTYRCLTLPRIKVPRTTPNVEPPARSVCGSCVFYVVCIKKCAKNLNTEKWENGWRHGSHCDGVTIMIFASFILSMRPVAPESTVSARYPHHRPSQHHHHHHTAAVVWVRKKIRKKHFWFKCLALFLSSGFSFPFSTQTLRPLLNARVPILF